MRWVCGRLGRQPASVQERRSVNWRDRAPTQPAVGPCGPGPQAGPDLVSEPLVACSCTRPATDRDLDLGPDCSLQPRAQPSRDKSVSDRRGYGLCTHTAATKPSCHVSSVWVKAMRKLDREGWPKPKKGVEGLRKEERMLQWVT